MVGSAGAASAEKFKEVETVLCLLSPSLRLQPSFQGLQRKLGRPLPRRWKQPLVLGIRQRVAKLRGQGQGQR